MSEVAAEAGTAPLRTYEIGLVGDVADRVRSLAPGAEVHSTDPLTVFWRHPRRPDEVDTLLQALSSLGIAPRELYESADYCEVRIDGCLGTAILHHLRWSHRLVQTTVVRVRLSHDALRTTLRQLADVGRLDYLLAC
ncbi:hypothetical protein [Microlunatus ginsengisoli]|uniref:Uncharacterized protein n=1 Tax=Microlunatus ginsengisoli TaxID=363863 RepID=A0ABP6ZJK9_9ACTN